jgi:hypothetical protein
MLSIDKIQLAFRIIFPRLGTMVHTCNSSYLEGRDQEDQGLRPAQAKNY